MDKETFIDNLLRSYLIEFVKWLKTWGLEKDTDIFDIVDTWMASDKANYAGDMPRNLFMLLVNLINF